MKFIFWNVKNRLNIEIILEILKHESPGLLFLAEAGKVLKNEDIERIQKTDYEYLDNPGCDRIRIIKKKDLKISLSKQSDYYSSLKYENVVIISVHLPSQMYQHMDGLKRYFRDLRTELDSEFGSSIEKDIVIVGDFNVNPFEKPLIDFDGFSASNSIKLNKEATHLKTKKALYYNPTWMLYSNAKFPGTKYFKRPSASAFDILEHHFLDQVIISYSMSQKVIYQKIELLEKTTNYTFFDQVTNSIKISDHLPLIYEYKIA